MSIYFRIAIYFFLLMVTSSVHSAPPDSVLIGFISKSLIVQNSDYKWGSEGFEKYTPQFSKGEIDFIKPRISKLNFTIVMGTWCEDSQNHVPKLLKILQQLEVNDNQIHIFCVNREKQITEPAIKSMNISYVPTIIFNENTIELGRIVENPLESLEKDLLEIIKKAK